MFGTVARMRVTPGKVDEMKALVGEIESRRIDGMVSSVVLQASADPQELWLVAVFRDRAAYMANADSPAQDNDYRRMRALLDADPEWHDGEVVFSELGSASPA